MAAAVVVVAAAVVVVADDDVVVVVVLLLLLLLLLLPPLALAATLPFSLFATRALTALYCIAVGVPVPEPEVMLPLVVWAAAWADVVGVA